jgi:hypothetical protein
MQPLYINGIKRLRTAASLRRLVIKSEDLGTISGARHRVARHTHPFSFSNRLRRSRLIFALSDR